MTDPDEQEIACGLRSGSTTAWCALYDRHAEGVWRLVARQMGGSSSEVADVVQETFLAAARSAHGFDAARGSLWGWLSGIARRHVALHWRMRKRQQRLYEADGRPALERERIMAWLENRAIRPPDAMILAETADLVRTALVDLPDEYAALLTQRYCDDEPVEHLAGAAGSTATAIRSKLARARRAFREAFAAVAPSHCLLDPPPVQTGDVHYE
jgi:RNA polymerase sigma-70 factor (ECF subfamily)